MKKILFFALAFLLLFLLSPWIFQAKADNFDPLPTEFAYSEERLSQSRSPLLITIERIDKWEAPLQHYFDKQKITYLTQVHFYTYLYLAQRDASFLSYNVHKCFVGSLDPLTKEVVLTFFPDFTDFPDLSTDVYSEELAKQIWPPYLNRIEKEKANPHIFTPCDEKPIAQRIQEVAKWIPWVSPLPTVPPPNQELKKQTEIMKTELHQLSEEQINLMYAWAGEKGLKRHWRIIANDYIQKESIPLGKTLFARSILMMGLYDSLIASMNAKYTYCVPRPIHSLLKKPQTPSYPSGHAAQAGTAEVILSYFFPKASDMWNQIADDSSQSRIWGGVHTHQETIEGERLGRQVGESTLNTFRQTSCCTQAPARRCPFSG